MTGTAINGFATYTLIWDPVEPLSGTWFTDYIFSIPNFYISYLNSSGNG